ncbi:MAG: hypothetical protein ABWX84_02050 [Nocardioides sp.]
MRRPIVLFATLVSFVLAGTLLGPSADGVPSEAAAASRWAPVSRATITPGVQMVTRGAQCTANFVFTDARDRVYVGYAAHCAGRGEATDTNGCRTRSVALGTPVAFVKGMSVAAPGARVGRGTLAYSSWITMRKRGLKGGPACDYNDFALVRVAAGSVRHVNPSVPFWGGPTRLGPGSVATGSRIHTYGNSGVRGGAEPLAPKTGASLGQSGGGWTHDAYTVTPGIPGDSGSGFMDAQGRAFGVLSTVAVAPLPASNGVGDLYREVRYARRHSGIPGLRLAAGTRAFDPVL